MKRFAILALLFFCISLINTSWGVAGEVRGTKHDLSMPVASGGTGPGPIQSTSAGTTEICVFCHTPHGARTGAPLWNRSMSTETYTVYTSDVLQALGMTADNPSDTGAADYAIHTKTRICLSCHDGTIALGTLANFPDGISNIPMSNSNAGRIPSTSAGYIGTDLSDDHPVAIKYNAGSGANQDPELRNLPYASGGKVRLYNYNIDGKVAAKRVSIDASNLDYVECTSCHNVHDNANGNFLIDPNLGSQICNSCHRKETGLAGGAGTLAHDNADGVGYNPDGTGSIGTTVGNVSCMTCHYPHRSGATGATYPYSAYTNPGGGQYLLSFQEENTCFNNPNRWDDAIPITVCHGSGSSTKDIETLVGPINQYAHKSSNNPGKHRATEQGNGDSAKYGTLAGDNWHVQCNDCHNPHTAGSVTHTSPIVGLTDIPDTSPLYGAGGVKIPAANNPPISSDFTAFESLGVTNSSSMHFGYYEYQICYKCHSSFAWGANPLVAPMSPSLGTVMTDQAAEFRTGNASFHPIQGTTGPHPGTLAPFPPAPFNWLANVGNQTMYCSDCHTNNGNVSPRGPHGSSNVGMLGWPPNGSQYGQIPPGQPQQNTDLCLQCHASAKYNQNMAGDTGGTGFTNAGNINLHNRHYNLENGGGSLLPNRRAYKCVNCHARVAHGMQRKALIVYRGDGNAYEAEGIGSGLINNGATLLPAPGNYIKTSCNSYNANGVTGCHD